MVELHVFANRGDPDQTPHSAAYDLGLHCFPNTLLRVSRLQWVKPFNSNLLSATVNVSLFLGMNAW